MFTDEGHSGSGRAGCTPISDINDWMPYFPILFVVLETNIGHNV